MFPLNPLLGEIYKSPLFCFGMDDNTFLLTSSPFTYISISRCLTDTTT